MLHRFRSSGARQKLQRFSRLIASISAALTMAVIPTLAVGTGLASADTLDTLSTQVSGKVNGTVLLSQPMSLSPTLSALATGKKIYYVSTNTTSQRILVSGAVLTPKPSVAAGKPTRGNIVAWAHGTTGMADKCAPSGTPDLFYVDWQDMVASYLSQGWTVTATDYPGLGTPGAHPYLIGDSEGRAVIDSVRAARNLDGSLKKNWVVSGNSQGGQAALFAGELASSYGTGLNLKGMVAIAPASNIDLIAQGIAGTPGQGYLVMALYGLAAVDPSVHPEQYLTTQALSKATVLWTGCGEDVLAAYQDFTAEQLLRGGQLPAEIIAKLGQQGNPAQRTSTAPIFLVQGDADETIPVDITYLLQLQECAVNPTVQLNIYPGGDHISTNYLSLNDVQAYILARFQNQPAPSNC